MLQNLTDAFGRSMQFFDTTLGEFTSMGSNDVALYVTQNCVSALSPCGPALSLCGPGLSLCGPTLSLCGPGLSLCSPGLSMPVSGRLS